MSVHDCTRDGFLGGRVVADQPRDGFRAGHDTVLLAAAVPAVSGETVLELGSGVGVASLCLAARVPDIHVIGMEIDAGLVRIASENAVLNDMADRVRFMSADASAFSLGKAFDHVFFNPPFHPEDGQVSPHLARDRAKRDTEESVGHWTRAALGLRPAGTVTAIVRADRVDEVLVEARGYAVTVFPLFPHARERPKRAIVRIAKGAPGRRETGGLVLHEADGGNTAAAEAVLRHGAALDLG